MSEQIYIYDLGNRHSVETADRDAFYRDQVKLFQETGRTSHAVEVINVFLFNDSGELLIQKRGAQKNHNPGLLDKSLGGHLRVGDKPDFTVMTETIEELFAPSIVLRDDFDFEKTRKRSQVIRRAHQKCELVWGVT